MAPELYCLDIQDAHLRHELSCYIQDFDEPHVFSMAVTQFNSDSLTLVLSPHLPWESALYAYPTPFYTIIDGRLVLIYNGLERLIRFNKYSYARLTFVQSLHLEDNWDEEKDKQTGFSLYCNNKVEEVRIFWYGKSPFSQWIGNGSPNRPPEINQVMFKVPE
ncbi:MAG: hypothetical protein EAZ89_06500 [Bacteroidetes bacterium]|nr:MAG: hypothetical protein EAZ89_06500 [Bacteroidota bacterium]